MRYFFDIAESGQVTPDENGLELETREDAASQAATILAEIGLHQLRTSGESSLTLQVAVREGQRVILNSRLTIDAEKSG